MTVTVEQLLHALLTDINEVRVFPPEALVVVAGQDHRFLPADVSLEDAYKSTDALGVVTYYENFGEDCKLNPDDVAVKVVFAR